MAIADRTRLAGRVQADYDGYGYTSLLPGDLKAAGATGNDAIDAQAAAEVAAALATAERTTAQNERGLAQTAATNAAAAVPATFDRVTGRRPSDTGLWNVTRAGSVFCFNSQGLLEEFATDTLAWDFDRSTLAPLGVSFQPARTNSITNPRANGAVAGTPGTRPTGWGVLPTGAPTVECLGPTTRNGVPGVSYRFSGVPTTTATQFWNLNTSISLSVGNLVATSGYFELVAGSMTNIQGTFSLRPNSTIAGTNFTPGAFTRVRDIWTSTLTSMQPCLRWVYADTVTPVDFTIFIGGLQSEVNAPYMSDLILPPNGSPAAQARAISSVNIPLTNFGTRWNRRAATIIIDFSSMTGAFTGGTDFDFSGLWSFGDLSADEVMGIVIPATHTGVVFRRTVGAVPQTTASVTTSAFLAGVSYRCAVAWDIDAGLVQVASRGVAGTQLTGQTGFPNMTHAMPGRFSTTRPLAGCISGVELRPSAVFGATLAALT